jgi:hypothetical protein
MIHTRDDQAPPSNIAPRKEARFSGEKNSRAGARGAPDHELALPERGTLLIAEARALHGTGFSDAKPI